MEILKIVPEYPEGTTLARLWLRGGRLEGDGPDDLLESLRKGVEGDDGHMYTPKDGVGFLKAVQDSYSDTPDVYARLVSRGT